MSVNSSTGNLKTQEHKMSNIAYTITDSAVTVLIDAKTYTVSKGDDRYTDVVNAIREGNDDEIPRILDIKGRLISESNGGLYLMNGKLRCDEYDVPATLATRIVKMFKNGFSVEPLTNFLSNLMENPNESGTVVEELYGFLEACNLPITPDGHFLAYKMVNPDFTDIYTGRMDNSVGAVVEMDRFLCDFNRDRTCSDGLHFCSEGYLGCYGTRSSSQVVVVKVNPRDVTSIPTDYDNAKGRACRYEIVDAISWDDIITPDFSDEYWEEPEQEELFDEPEGEVDAMYFGDHRWEVRDSETGEYFDAFMTRDEAREHVRGSDEPCFIWDTQNQQVAGGTVDPDLSEYLNNGGLVDEYMYDSQEVPFDEPTSDPVNTGAKLTVQDVADIKSELNDMQSGESPYSTYAELARAYGVSDRSIRRIRDGEAWVDVPAAW
jgi:hypothetical protein